MPSSLPGRSWPQLILGIGIIMQRGTLAGAALLHTLSAAQCLAHTAARPCLGADPDPEVTRNVPVNAVVFAREERHLVGHMPWRQGMEHLDLAKHGTDHDGVSCVPGYTGTL